MLSAAGNVMNIFLIKDVLLPSHPTVIDQDDQPVPPDPWTEIHTHTEGLQHSPSSSSSSSSSV